MSKELEKEGDGRWIVRAKDGTRLGVILGATGRYQAQTARGALIGQASTLAATVALFNKVRR